MKVALENMITNQAFIELKDLVLPVKIGSEQYIQENPETHLLDLTLLIDTKWVMICEDDMKKVFDYDPLILEIRRLVDNTRYETQERLVTLIVEACAKYRQINAVDIFLRKTALSTNASTGALGVRLRLDKMALSNMR
jgi:dihydroneopterin aldolase